MVYARPLSLPKESTLRSLSLTLLTLCLTGCATTGPSAAQRRAAEIEAYRQRKAVEPAADAAETTRNAPPPSTQAPASTPAPSASPEATPVASAPPAAPTGPVGPRAGVYGLRASLLGGSLTSEQAGNSSLGFRYFVTDSVGFNVDAGFLYSSLATTAFTGASLGLGLNLYGGTPGKAPRPYFTVQAALNHLNTDSDSATLLGASLGGGVEFWLAPQLSVNTTLAVGFATTTTANAVVLGTVQPGLGVTLFLD
jgi:hypothetical protein